METLPSLFWLLYYLFFIITIGIAILKIVKKRLLSLSILAIGLSFLAPFTNFMYSLGRKEGLNEWDNLMINVKDGDLWAIFILVLHLYLIVYWIFVFVNWFKKAKQ